MLGGQRLQAGSLEGLHGRYSEEESWETVGHCDRCCYQHQHRCTGAEGGLGPVREGPAVSLLHLGVLLGVPGVWS